ncbi:MAG: hypothetical protein ACRCTK_02055, partial [Alphaproteobacteria bacterium]
SMPKNSQTCLARIGWLFPAKIFKSGLFRQSTYTHYILVKDAATQPFCQAGVGDLLVLSNMNLPKIELTFLLFINILSDRINLLIFNEKKEV